VNAAGGQSTVAALRLSLTTIRTRWVTFAGAFFALAGGVAIIVPMLLLVAAGVRTPFPGPQRFAAAPAVVVPNDGLGLTEDGYSVGLTLGQPPPLSPALVAKIAATGRVITDRTFGVHTPGGPGGQVGHEWSAAALGRYRLLAGRAPAAADQVVLASESVVLVGHSILVDTPAGARAYVVSGVVAPQWFESAVFFTDQAAARLDPPVQAVAAFASPAAVARAVGRSATILTGAARVQADPDPTGGSDLLTGTELTAETAAAVIAFVAIFVMVGTFAFVVDLRRREIALLRLVGATSRQVRRMIVGEAALIGVAAALAGAAAGACGRHLVGHYAVSSGNAPGWFTVGFTWWPVLAGFAVGVISALAGSAVSAWRAGRVAPLEALREAAVDQRVMTPLRWLLGIAALAAALCFAVDNLVSAPFELTNPRKTIEIPLLFVAAFALLAPVLLAPLARWVTWPLTRLGPGSMIVRANIGTAARRTAAVAGAAVVAVGVATAFFVQQDNASSALTYQATQTSRADYVVVPVGGATLPAAAIAALRQVPGARVVPVQDIVLYVGTRQGEFIDSFNAQAVSAGALPGVEDPTVLSGSVRGFGPGSLVVDEKGARADGLRVGMRLAVWGPDGTRQNVTLTAIVATGLAGDLAYVSAGVAPTAPTGRVDVGVLPGASPAAVRTAILTAVRGQPATVMTRAQAVSAMETASHRESRGTTILVLGIALAYSLIAMANTMVMASAGRRRELAALNLTGVTRPQILGYVAAESLIAVVLGAIVGAASAIPVVIVMLFDLTGLIGSFPVSLPWETVGAVGGTCAAIGVLAATITSARSMRGRAVELAGLRD
jgi:putative ABC transport system permease protein